MGVLFGLILILFSAAWGSVFLYQILRRLTGRVGPPEGNGVTPMLLEEVESLSGRLARVEEELEFYKQLKAPEVPGEHTDFQGPEDQDS